MGDKAISENGATLNSVLDCYKNQEICNKAVDNYPHVLEFVPECYKTSSHFIFNFTNLCVIVSFFD